MKNLLIFLLLCSPLHAATYYVSKTGSDAHGCSTTDSAGTNKLTITAGMGCLASGDLLYIHSGTYTEQVIVPAAKSGTSWATATTISAFTGETVTVNGNANPILSVANSSRYIIFQNIIVDGTNQTPVDGGTLSGVGTADHIRFSNMEMKNAQGFIFVAFQDSSYIEIIGGSYHDCQDSSASSSPAGYAFYYTPSTGGIIDGAQIYNVQNIGIQLNLYVPSHPTSYTRNNIIRNCTIRNVSRSTVPGHPSTAIGIIVGGGHAEFNTVYNNVIYGSGTTGNTEYGIQIGGGIDNAFYNNTIYNCFNGAIYFLSFGGAITSPKLQNNILYQNGSSPVVINPGDTPTTPTYSNNLSNVSGTGITVVGNPQFVSTVTPDFHIQTTSAAKDAGTTIAVVTLDKDGFARPQGSAYDIGAYEFISAVPPPLSTISMTYPNGNENLTVGTAINITWTSNDTHTVSLELSRDGGATYSETIVTGLAQTADANNSYAWTPTAPRTLTTKIRVTNLFDLVTDESNASCNIRGHYVK